MWNLSLSQKAIFLWGAACCCPSPVIVMPGRIYLSSYGNSKMVQFPNSTIYIQADRQIECFTYRWDGFQTSNYERESIEKKKCLDEPSVCYNQNGPIRSDLHSDSQSRSELTDDRNTTSRDTAHLHCVCWWTESFYCALPGNPFAHRTLLEINEI